MPHIADRWVWIGFGIFLFFAAKGVRYAITDIVNLTEVKSRPKEETEPSRPEDSISIDDLKTLATSPSANIRNAATSLIISRLARSPEVLTRITKDANASNEETRRKARRTLNFLNSWDVMDLGLSPYGEYEDSEEGGDFLPSAVLPRASNSMEHSNQDIVASLEEISAEIGVPLDVPLAAGSWIPAGRPPATTNPDEAARRRQRREAMVFHEGDGRLVEEDIIRPRR